MSLASSTLISLLGNRRSYYSLSAKSPVEDARLKQILSDILLTVPSAFNSQTSRMVLVLHDEHRHLWDIVKQCMLAKLGEERFPATGKKLDGFKNAYGTILFYEDERIVQEYKEKFHTYRDQFQPWSDHASGMHQLSAWVALEADGFGVNLQHYNPLIDEKVGEAFKVPTNYRLVAQMVFGTPEGDKPAAKDKIPVEQRLSVFGANL